MSHEQCVALWQDKRSRFHQLWGRNGWEIRNHGDRGCWDNDGGNGYSFFDDAWWGRSCARNWYTGNGGNLGQPTGGPTKADSNPHFSGDAPALLGFDEAIDEVCGGNGNDHAQSCIRRNVNILSLYGSQVPYNICRNTEWQICAAKGTLPGQGGLCRALQRDKREK